MKPEESINLLLLLLFSKKMDQFENMISRGRLDIV